MDPITQLPAGACPVCGNDDIRSFLNIRNVPVHCNILWKSREDAVNAPRGDIELGFCNHCDHIFNRRFNPMLMEYSEVYENSLHFSPRFQSYAEDLAKELIRRYQLYNKDIIEIGCGKGDFLSLLCENGENRGTGFDPSYEPDRQTYKTDISFVRDFYSPEYAHLTADLVCCRHVLEHVENPFEFVSTLACTLSRRPEAAVYFEVPDAAFILKGMSIWDIIYEHVSYFSSASLSNLFASAGFSINDVRERFNGQFVSLEASVMTDPGKKRDERGKKPSDLTDHAAMFSKKFEDMLARRQREIENLHDRNQRAVVWGAGSKGVTFLNLVDSGFIDCVVDINPNKQGRYVPGTGHLIVPPEALKDRRQDKIYVMNPAYEEEIQNMLVGMGITADLDRV